MVRSYVRYTGSIGTIIAQIETQTGARVSAWARERSSRKAPYTVARLSGDGAGSVGRSRGPRRLPRPDPLPHRRRLFLLRRDQAQWSDELMDTSGCTRQILLGTCAAFADRVRLYT